MRLSRSLSLLALVLTVPGAVHAQTVGERQRVVLTDGRTIVGTIVEVRDDAVVVEVRGIRSEVPRSRIARVEAPGRFDAVDPLGTRLFLTPTARTMPKGSVRLSTVYYVLPNLAYGVTGNLDVSATASIPIPDGGLVSGNVKFAPVQSGSLAVAVGASVGTLYGREVTSNAAGTFYGIATVGDVHRAVTVGAYGVYAGYDGDVKVGNGMGLVVGGEIQVSNNVKVISENAFLRSFEGEGGNGGAVTAGVRFFSGRVAADLSYPFVVFADGNSETFPLFFPLVSLGYTIR